MPVIGVVDAAKAHPEATERMLRMAKRATLLFSQAFPTIKYEVLWRSQTVNAKAWWGRDGGRVCVYGGLARQPALKIEGWLIVLAHETGHILGREPYSNFILDLSCECQADYWAVNKGLPSIVDVKLLRSTIEKGLEQLTSIFGFPMSQTNNFETANNPLCDLDFRARQLRLLQLPARGNRIVPECPRL